jgi:membrane dipeptidase
MSKKAYPLLWLLAAAVGFRFLPSLVERRINRVASSGTLRVSPEAAELHRKLFIVDLHADSLLVKRNLLRRSRQGHVDLPRLQQANVGLQVFGVVTRIPVGMNFERNSASQRDLFPFMAAAMGWRTATWRSMLSRALYQAQKLDQLERKSDGRLRIIRTAGELGALTQARQSGEQVTGGMLSLEGVHALEGRLENLDLLYDAGFRILGLTHFTDNEAGGSAHGESQQGLTPFGRELARAAQGKHMILDLAHASPALFRDVLAMASAPVIVSHSGVRGTCDNSRNLSDDQLKAVAENGGLVGIAYFPRAVGSPTVAAVVAAFRHAAGQIGVENLALGSDFDGGIMAPFDVTGLPALTSALLGAGFTAVEVEQLMGGNALRVLRKALG